MLEIAGGILLAPILLFLACCVLGVIGGIGLIGVEIVKGIGRLLTNPEFWIVVGLAAVGVWLVAMSV